jgi:hypothetical protein
MREIVNGKLGPIVTGLQFLFETTELWKNVQALGGASSLQQFPSGEKKGEPLQSANYSIQAVPAKIKDVDFIDPRRRA